MYFSDNALCVPYICAGRLLGRYIHCACVALPSVVIAGAVAAAAVAVVVVVVVTAVAAFTAFLLSE